MIGRKERAFDPIVAVSLEALVPPDHFYRHLDRILDLSFVHALVQETYASLGRPSIDPVVFFKAQCLGRTPLCGGERLAWIETLSVTQTVEGQLRGVSNIGRAESQAALEQTRLGTATTTQLGCPSSGC